MNHTQNLACWAHNFAQAPDFCLDVFTSFVDREIDDRGQRDVVKSTATRAGSNRCMRRALSRPTLNSCARYIYEVFFETFYLTKLQSVY